MRLQTVKAVIELAQRSKVEVEIIPLSKNQTKLRFKNNWIIDSMVVENEQIISLKSKFKCISITHGRDALDNL